MRSAPRGWFRRKAPAAPAPTDSWASRIEFVERLLTKTTTAAPCAFNSPDKLERAAWATARRRSARCRPHRCRERARDGRFSRPYLHKSAGGKAGSRRTEFRAAGPPLPMRPHPARTAPGQKHDKRKRPTAIGPVAKAHDNPIPAPLRRYRLFNHATRRNAEEALRHCDCDGAEEFQLRPAIPAKTARPGPNREKRPAASTMQGPAGASGRKPRPTERTASAPGHGSDHAISPPECGRRACGGRRMIRQRHDQAGPHDFQSEGDQQATSTRTACVQRRLAFRSGNVAADGGSQERAPQ